MTTYLALCQQTARETGTISGTLPTAVTGQTGRLLQIVSSVAQAWRDIQIERNAWRWMRAGWSGVTVAGTARYAAATFSLTRWAEWIRDKNSLSIYLQSAGNADEGSLVWLDWPDWELMFDRGPQTAMQPVYWSISEAGELCLGPKPDAVYVLRGKYRKSPQELTANSDVPEMPVRFHDLIAWKALLKVVEFDEPDSPLPLARAQREATGLLYALERDQLPQLELGHEPLA